MSKFVLALLALGVVMVSTTPVQAASTTSISASPPSSVAGQTVTFTAAFTSACPGAVTSHWFTIDGQGVNGTFVQNGQAGTETLSTSTLTAGAHDISYYWKIQGTICRGLAPDMTYTVSPAPPPPTLPPSPSPSPRANHPPTPTPTPSPVALVASQQSSDSPLVGYLGGALILVVIVAGIGLMVVNRR